MCQRLLIEIMQHVFQFFVSRPSRSEASSIGLTQCGYECIAVLFADFAILISMAAIEPHIRWHNDFLGSMRAGIRRIGPCSEATIFPFRGSDKVEALRWNALEYNKRAHRLQAQMR